MHLWETRGVAPIIFENIGVLVIKSWMENRRFSIPVWKVGWYCSVGSTGTAYDIWCTTGHNDMVWLCSRLYWTPKRLSHCESWVQVFLLATWQTIVCCHWFVCSQEGGADMRLDDLCVRCVQDFTSADWFHWVRSLRRARHWPGCYLLISAHNLINSKQQQ